MTWIGRMYRNGAWKLATKLREKTEVTPSAYSVRTKVRRWNSSSVSSTKMSNMCVERWFLDSKSFCTHLAMCWKWTTLRFVFHFRRKFRYQSSLDWSLHPTDSENIPQISASVSSTRRTNWISSNSTHTAIALQSVWHITRYKNVAVSNFQCHVRRYRTCLIFSNLSVKWFSYEIHFLLLRTGNESTKICGPAKIECYMQAKQSLFEEDIVDGLLDNEARLFRGRCNCLPSCTTVTYRANIDRAKLHWREALLRTLNWTSEEVYRWDAHTLHVQ